MVFLHRQGVHIHETCYTSETAAVEFVQCSAYTRKGHRCPNGTSPGFDLCHVHEPALQCGFKRKNGSLCKVATGGKRCPTHANKPENAS